MHTYKDRNKNQSLGKRKNSDLSAQPESAAKPGGEIKTRWSHGSFNLPALRKIFWFPTV